MRLGFVGAGNMARGLVRGLDRPVLLSDPRHDVAAQLADEVGGTVAADNAALARAADVVILAHKPQQLHEVAADVAPHARTVASILGGVPLGDVRAAYPDHDVIRLMPSTPVEVRQGVVLWAAGSDPCDELRDALGTLGTLIELPEPLIDAGMGLMSCAPAYWALLVEAQVDAGIRHGVPPDLATTMVVQTMAGTAALLARDPDGDTLKARRAVTSPGGSTARGLAALERGGVRTAFLDAMRAVLPR